MPLNAGSHLSQMMLLAGMILLAWVLVRRNLKMRRQRRKADREVDSVNRQQDTVSRGAPLADAPREILRWQSAMFDLQRDLKAELDTRILVVQSLLRQADDRIAKLEGNSSPSGSVTRRLPVSNTQFDEIRRLHAAGHSAAEIAGEMGVAQAEIELSLGLGADHFGYSRSD